MATPSASGRASCLSGSSFFVSFFASATHLDTVELARAPRLMAARIALIYGGRPGFARGASKS